MFLFVVALLLQEKSNKEIDLTYQLKVLQQELEQEEASHKTTRTLLADKSKIKVTIEGAKSESMKGESSPPAPTQCPCGRWTHGKEGASLSDTEQKLAEERGAKLRLENRILELEKHSSMMDCDYKQALQKLEELRRHKDQLTEEVGLLGGLLAGLGGQQQRWSSGADRGSSGGSPPLR